jgi:hypothetical protein
LRLQGGIMTAFNTSAGGVRERPPPKNETPGRGGSRPEADFKNSSNTTACKPRRAILQEMRATELRRLRRLRRVKTIVDMRAPRLWFEMLDQAARDLGADDYIDALLERFAGLDADILRALGADKLPASPIHAVRGAR